MVVLDACARHLACARSRRARSRSNVGAVPLTSRPTHNSTREGCEIEALHPWQTEDCPEGKCGLKMNYSMTRSGSLRQASGARVKGT